MKVMQEMDFDVLMNRMNGKLEEMGYPLPSVSLIALEDNDPYRILIATILSLRTKDKVTMETSQRLFAIAKDFKELEELSEETIAEAIRPSAFFNRKAVQLKTIAHTVNTEYNGKLPCDMDALMALPGVGIKTASLVLNLGFDTDAICVDCHVHQIVNRLGLVNTNTPEETEREMRKFLPRRFWIPLNETLVRYGQAVCTPISPFCSTCAVSDMCPKKGIEKSR